MRYGLFSLTKLFASGSSTSAMKWVGRNQSRDIFKRPYKAVRSASAEAIFFFQPIL